MKRIHSSLQLGPVMALEFVFTGLAIVPFAAAQTLGKAPATAARTAAQAAPASNSWTTHNDPAGFAVDLPAEWTVAKDPTTGQIAIRGARGERVVIWPLFLNQVQLDSRGAAAMIRQLAGRFDAQLPWNAVAPKQNVARLMAAGGGRGASAMLSWANGPSGASVYFYGIEAPAEVYRASTDSFVAILKSFHVVQDASVKNAAQAASGAGGALSFVNWKDPHEGAFSTSVPQGWQVIGGAYRLSPVDVRYEVAMGSPDGEVRAAVGDASLGGFIQPTQMLAMAGLREGMNYQLGDGSQLNIRRWMTGQQFARGYVELVLSKWCTSPQISSNNVREDLAPVFNQAARAEGFNVAVSAGDAAFTCNLNGRTVQGKYVAGTIQVPGSGIWFAYRLYGYLVVAGREKDAEKALAEAGQDWKFNPQWLAQQKNTADAAVMQDNIRSQQLRQRAQQAIAEDQRQTSDMIMKGWEQRNKVYDEIDRRRENAILGTVDVVDPESGKQYKISNYGDYHYMSNSGAIYSTYSPDTPPPDLREMIALP
jgi:hypothetical protein